MPRGALPAGTHAVGMAGYAPLDSAALLERIWAAHRDSDRAPDYGRHPRLFLVAFALEAHGRFSLVRRRFIAVNESAEMAVRAARRLCHRAG
jgi:hypothetical protein